jgi:hypothetical protein
MTPREVPAAIRQRIAQLLRGGDASPDDICLDCGEEGGQHQHGCPSDSPIEVGGSPDYASPDGESYAAIVWRALLNSARNSAERAERELARMRAEGYETGTRQQRAALTRARREVERSAAAYAETQREAKEAGV